MTTTQLLGLSMNPIIRAIKRWWFTRVEDHNLMCAAAEKKAEDQARANAKHYQKQAALARSARNSM